MSQQLIDLAMLLVFWAGVVLFIAYFTGRIK